MRSSISGRREPSLEVSMPAEKKPLLRIVIVLIVIAIVVAGLILYLRESRKPQEIVLSGALEARTVNVGTLVGGRATNTLFDSGMTIVPRQLLVALSSETIDREI